MPNHFLMLISDLTKKIFIIKMESSLDLKLLVEVQAVLGF